MDCDVCGLRSSVGYCAVCRKLLCEVCSVGCERCAKLLCPDHIEKTHGGRSLCEACMEDRRTRREARKDEERRKEEAEDMSFAALGEGAAGPREGAAGPREGVEVGPREKKEEQDEERPILIASGYQPKPFWWRSMLTWGAGVLITMVVVRHPTLLSIAQPWVSLVVAGAAGLAMLHAGAGLRNKERHWTWYLNFIAMGLAILLLVFACRGFYVSRELD